ncbi:MAG TPA: hypothetical protein VFP72_19110, partial [Kineosporiaceae bacterium]|nr:hypothetical protein [Kineosporiaceae bacterium]
MSSEAVQPGTEPGDPVPGGPVESVQDPAVAAGGAGIGDAGAAGPATAGAGAAVEVGTAGGE